MKMKQFFHLFIFFYLFRTNANAQSLPIYEDAAFVSNVGNRISSRLDTCTFILAPSCGTVSDTVFDLKTLSSKCFKMNAPPLVSPAPDPLCSEGGSPHNMSWMAFQAGFGNYNLNVLINKCTGGQSGAQFGIYQIIDCDFGSAIEIFCKGSPCLNGSTLVPSQDLIPGEIYYFWMDGCAGSVCDFEVKVEGDYTPFNMNVNTNVFLNIGGSIWGTFEPDSLKKKNDRGGARTMVLLKNLNLQKTDTTFTNNNGDYLFMKKPGSHYIIELPYENFKSGGPLFGLKPCTKFSDDLYIDNDNNGSLKYGYMYATSVLDLTFPNSNGDTISNTSFDFCFFGGCNTINPLTVSSIEKIKDTICDLSLLPLSCLIANSIIDPNNTSKKLCSNKIQAYNTETFAFTAGKGSYSLSILVESCIGGVNGAQIIVIDAMENLEVFCSGEKWITGKQTISSNLLIPGRVYYFLINGGEGSICNYTINLNGSYVPFSPRDEAVFPEIGPYCVNEEVSFFTNIDQGVYEAKCTWNIYKLSDNSVTKIITKTSKLDYVFKSNGIYLVELASISTRCGNVGFTPVNKAILVEQGINCNGLKVQISKVQKISCTTKGYVITKISNGQLPYQVFIDDVIQNSLDTHYIEKSGFHELKVVDATGLNSTNEFWIGGNSVQLKHDLTVNFVSPNFRRGITNQASIVVSNNTCKKVTGQLTMVIPNEVILINTSPSPSSISGNVFKWNFLDLENDFIVNLNLKTSLNTVLGQNLDFNFSTSPIDTDLHPEDNNKSYSFEVTGSFDPNDKIANPKGTCVEHFITKDQNIIYTIRFQNVGTAAAKDVYIVDTLDKYLDINSLDVLAYSNNMILERINKINKNVLKFSFPDIELPPKKDNEEASNGFVIFKVKIKNDTPDFSRISNKSEIYFDFNDAVITNEVFHTIVTDIPKDSLNVNISNCQKNYVTINKIDFSKDTIVSINYLSKSLCDSIVTYNIKINELKYLKDSIDVCFGSVVLDQIIKNDTTLVREIGCDTIYSIKVEVAPEIEVPIFADQTKLITADGFNKYTWIDCNNETNKFITSEPFYSPTYISDYKVEVEKDGCKGISDCKSFIVSTNNINQSYFSIYPNPSSNGEFYINFYSSFKFNADNEIKIYDVKGQSIKAKIEKLGDSQYKVSQLQKGSYLISINSGKEFQSKVVMVY